MMTWPAPGLCWLQAVDGDVGKGVLSVLNASQPQPPTEAILTTLLNEIAACSAAHSESAKQIILTSLPICCGSACTRVRPLFISPLWTVARFLLLLYRLQDVNPQAWHNSLATSFG